MPEVIKRHALLFTVVLGGVVLLVLVIFMRQKASTNSASSANSANGTAGDSGLTSGYGESIYQPITNIYGQQPDGSTSSSAGSSTGSSAVPSIGGLSSPMPPIAPPPASGAQSITTNATYASGGLQRLPPEPSHKPVRLRRLPPVSAQG